MDPFLDTMHKASKSEARTTPIALNNSVDGDKIKVAVFQKKWKKRSRHSKQTFGEDSVEKSGDDGTKKHSVLNSMTSGDFMTPQ